MSALRSLVVTQLFLGLRAFGQWQDISVTPDNSFYGLDYRANGNVWAVEGDSVLYSLDHGNTFTPRAIDDPFGNTFLGLLRDAHAFNNNDAVIAGLVNISTGIVRTDNAGGDYVLAYGGSVFFTFMDLDLEQAPIGIAVGGEGEMARTIDNGVTWQSVASGTAVYLNAVAWVGGSNYVASGDGGMIRSSDNGLTWAPVAGPTELEFLSSPVSGTCYGSTDWGEIWRSTDGGVSWTEMATVPNAGAVTAIKAVDANTLFVATDAAGIFRSHTAGQFWEHFDIPGYQHVRAMDFYDADHGMAVGVGGYVLRTANGGGAAMPMIDVSGPSGAHCTGVTLSYSTSGDPAYSYQWLVDGMLQSTAYLFDYVTSAVGPHTIAVVADNGQFTDTAERVINVAPPAAIAPFQALATSDTVCPGLIVGFSIPVSQQGVSYLLQNGATVLDGELSSGNPINYCCNFSFSTQPDLFIRASVTNLCGSAVDTLPIPLYMVEPQPGVAYALSNDSACDPVSAFMIVQNSVAGWQYSADGFITWQVGNGGALQLPVAGQPPGFWVTLRTRPVGTTCSVPQGAALHMTVLQPSVEASAASPFTLEGSPVDFSLTPDPLLTYHWDFGPGSSPSSFVGPLPPPVIYVGTGARVVQVEGIVQGSLCVVPDTASVTVYAQNPTLSVPICEEIPASGDMYAADMHVDAFGNMLIAGTRSNVGGSANYAFYVAKLDSTGTELWSFTHTDANYSDSRAIAVTGDVLGNTYVTVWNEYASTLQGHYVTAGESLLKFDHAGALDWVVLSNFHLHGVACTKDNTIHVLGVGANGFGSLTLPDGSMHTLAPDPGDGSAGMGCVVSLKPNGTLVDAVRFGRYELDAQPGQFFAVPQLFDPYIDSYSRSDPQIDVLADGSLLIAGMMGPLTSDRTFSFGGMPLASNADSMDPGNQVQAYTAVYKPQVGFLDAQSLFGGGLKAIKEVATAPDGGWYALVSLTDHFVWGDSVRQFSPGQYNDVLVKTDSTGEVLWHVSTRYGVWQDLVVKPDGSVIVLATVAEFATMPSANGALSAALTADGDADRILLHYSSSGMLLGADQGSGSVVTIAFASDEDVCGNAHMLEADSDAPYYASGFPVSCIGPCGSNVRIRRMDLGGCAAGCYDGVSPGSFDLGLEDAHLDNNQPLPPGPRDVRVTLVNWGEIPVTSLQICYRLNSDPAQCVAWNGVLTFSDSLSEYLIGSPSFGAQFHNNIAIWIASVNGGQDNEQWNDTLFIRQDVCTGPLNGTYTVGGGGGDFQDLPLALEVLHTCGIAGVVHFQLAAGTYTDPIALRAIPGADANDTIVFFGTPGDSSMVRLVPGVIALDSAAYFSFVGMALDGAQVWLGRDTKNINFIRCTFTGTQGSGAYALWGGQFGFESIRLVENTFRYHDIGVYCIPNIPTYLCANVTLIANRFEQQADYGIWMGGQQGLNIVDNVFEHDYDLDGNPSYRAFSVGTWDQGSAVIMNNFARGVVSTITPDRELILAGMGGAANTPSWFANNMIFWTLPVDRPAVQLHGEDYRVVHNTLSSGIDVSANVAVSVRNNIFGNGDPQPAIAVDYSWALIDVDQNLFSGFDTTALATPFRKGNVDYDLGQWRSLGYDINSNFLDPLFVGVDDLHLAPGNVFQCPAYPGIITDIDGDPRSLWMPRHGADEGDLSVSDASGGIAQAEWTMIPNPGYGEFAITGLGSGPVEVHITDAAGRLVAQRTTTARDGRIDMALDLRPGVYQVRVSNNGTMATSSLIVLAR